MTTSSGRTGRRGFIAAAGGGVLAAGGGVAAGRADPTVDPELTDASGTVSALVRLQAADPPESGKRSAVIDALRTHAETTQRRVESYVSEWSGIEVRRRFWLANALVVEIDTATFDPERLATLDEVVRIHRPSSDTDGPTTTGRRLEYRTAQQDDPAEGGEFSYGLELMNVPQVWERYGVRGEGVTVAVIDTGADPGHPDIDLSAWAEFDADGQRVDSDPHDPDGHGTGMSSLAVGGDASGTHIGVAPEAELLASKVDEGDFFTSTMAGLEWAVENGADVVSISIEFGLYNHEAIEPIENAAASGVAVTTAAGDLDMLWSPGNVHSGVIAGVVDANEEPYHDGNGGEIRTGRYWRGASIPDDWPEQYVIPDGVTAGVDVLAAVPEAVAEERHMRTDGYSNGPPHVAGVIALLQSAAEGQLSVPEIKDLLRDTARQPGEPFTNDAHNAIYGSGIIDACHAVSAVLDPDGEISGTVTDDSGEPIEGATVTFETGVLTTTDQAGQYALSGVGNGGTVTVRATGYESEQRTVAIGDDGDIVLDSEISPDIARAEREPTYLESGGSASMQFEIAHADAALVSMEEIENRVTDEELTLSINDDPATLDEPVDISDDESTLRIGIDASEDAIGRLRLHVAVGEETEDGIEPSEIILDPIAVHPNPLRLEPGADLQRAVDIAAPETRIELAEGEYEVGRTPFDRPFPAARTEMFEPVFGPAMEDSVGLVVDKPLTITASGEGTPRIVAHGDDGAGIAVRITANYVTMDGIGVDGGGAGTALNVLDGSGVHLDRVVVRNASVGVHSQFNASLAVRDSEFTVTGTGVLLTAGTQNALVRSNRISGAERGVFLDGQPFDVSAEIEDNQFDEVDTDVEGDGFVDVPDHDIGAEPPGDSSLDLLLYAMTAASVGALFVPYAFRRYR